MSTVTSKQLADMLNNFPCGDTFTKHVINIARKNNLVILTAFGNDKVFLSGAITDEFDLHTGGYIYMGNDEGEITPFTRPGTNRIEIHAFYEEHKQFTWKFITKIKHETFITRDKQKSFCQAIVINLSDLTLATKRT